MLGGDVSTTNSFMSAPTPEPDLCRDIELIKCDDTLTANGYANFNHVSDNDEDPGACENPGEVDNDVEKVADVPKSSEVEITWIAFQTLRKDLERAQQELRTRDEQCRALSRVRDEVDLEIEELTASLFEEAHKMVNDANVGRASAEKKLHETQLKLDGLQAEVAALKVLVITSTPAKSGTNSIRKASSTSPLCSYCDTYVYATTEYNERSVVEPSDKKEVDPLIFQFFVSWIEGGCPFKENEFLALILKDDITPCLRFSNDDLAKLVYKAVQNNTLAIEPIQSKPKKCSLSNIVGHCTYRIRLADMDLWYPISSSCRARIVSVIDFLTFLRYIQQGILKKDINVLYWQMMKKRAEISLARLGMERKSTSK